MHFYMVLYWRRFIWSSPKAFMTQATLIFSANYISSFMVLNKPQGLGINVSHLLF